MPDGGEKEGCAEISYWLEAGAGIPRAFAPNLSKEKPLSRAALPDCGEAEQSRQPALGGALFILTVPCPCVHAISFAQTAGLLRNTPLSAPRTPRITSADRGGWRLRTRKT